MALYMKFDKKKDFELIYRHLQKCAAMLDEGSRMHDHCIEQMKEIEEEILGYRPEICEPSS